MSKTYFSMEVNSARESWRAIRSIRADPPPHLRARLQGQRAKVFQMALEQAQQQFTAATSIGYESRPLNLFYGLTQGARAIAAASAQLGPQLEDKFKVWKATGHGLKFAPQLDKDGGLMAAPIRLDSSDRDLFSRVSLALGSPLDFGSAQIGQLLSQIPEYTLEFGPVGKGPRGLMPNGISDYAQPMQNGDFAWEVSLPGFGDMDILSASELRSALDQYPALRHAILTVDTDEEVSRSHNDGYVKLAVPLEPLVRHPQRSSSRFPMGTRLYRRHHVILPAIGQSRLDCHPLMLWWLVLYSLSMLARYSPEEWTAILAISTSSIASQVEHLLDSALDAVPDLISEALIEVSS